MDGTAKGLNSAEGIDEQGAEATQEVDLDTSVKSEEEEAAIEQRKEKIRKEIKEVKLVQFKNNICYPSNTFFKVLFCIFKLLIYNSRWKTTGQCVCSCVLIFCTRR